MASLPAAEERVYCAPTWRFVYCGLEIPAYFIIIIPVLRFKLVGDLWRCGRKKTLRSVRGGRLPACRAPAGRHSGRRGDRADGGVITDRFVIINQKIIQEPRHCEWESRINWITLIT